MYGMDEFFESVKELNEEELFYKEYYRIKKESPEKLGEYLEMLDREMMQEKGLWLPEIRQTSASYFTEYFVEDIRKNVEISIHNRYTPLFLHKHAFFEMVYVYSGQCENTIDGNKIVMNKGDICIIAPDVNHTMGVFDDDSIVFNIIIRRSTFREIFEGIFTDDTALSLFFNRILYSNTTNSHLLFVSEDYESLHSCIKFLIWEGSKKEKYYKPAMENLLRTAFCLMLRRQECMVVSSSLTTEDPEILHILRYIQDNYKTVNLNDLSDKFKYSPDYMGKLIKKNTGTTFIKILRDIKFKKACNMLLNTNLNVIDICYEVGYESVEYFTRSFKKLCGMTPTEYRKQASNLKNIPPSQRSIELNTIT